MTQILRGVFGGRCCKKSTFALRFPCKTERISWHAGPKHDSSSACIGARAEAIMRPPIQQETAQADLFRARLDEILNLDHELVELARLIDCKRCPDPTFRSGSGGGLMPNHERSI
jgi:hypothetical protein